MRSPASTLSVVIPVLNERENLVELLPRLRSVLEAAGVFEIVVVDDGSTDGTDEVLASAYLQDHRVKSVRLARRFGHQAAIAAGLRACTGDAVVVMDGDLQDPPEAIPQLVEQWRNGADVAYAVRSTRDASLLSRAAYKTFYRVLGSISHVEIPLDTGDFSIMDRRVVNLLNVMPEKPRFIRGLRSWVGLRQVAVPVHREARRKGRPKYTIRSLVRLAFDGFVGFSYLPLQLASVLGLIVSAAALLLAFGLVLLKVFRGIPLTGWTSLMVSVLFLGGIQLICVGILGEYVGRIYDDTRARPPFVVESTLGETRLEAPSARQL